MKSKLIFSILLCLLGMRASAILVTVGNFTICGTSSAAAVTLSGGGTSPTWSCSSPNVSITASGSTCLVKGEAVGGTATITFHSSYGYYYPVAHVIAATSGITGGDHVCLGSTLQLYDADAGGVWSPTTGVIVGVSSTGLVSTSGSVGTGTISYTHNSCPASLVVTVDYIPNNIRISKSKMCLNDTATVLDWPAPVGTGIAPYTLGGTFSAGGGVVSVGSTMAAPTIPTMNAIVTAVAGGTGTITYTLPNGCYKTTGVTVNATPITILSGSQTLCGTGASITLTDGAAGGTWSASPSGIVSLSGAETVTALPVSVATVVTITVTPGGTLCPGAITVTVYPTPAITGGLTTTDCPGTTTLTGSPAGGTWSGGNAYASINPVTGVVTGLSSTGTCTFTYLVASGCSATATVTVNPCCLNTSLIINTGYDPTNPTVPVTPVANLATPTSANLDPHWTVVGISSGASWGIGMSGSGATAVSIGSPANVVTTVNPLTYPPGWVPFPQTTGQVGNWINCLNANYYYTDQYPGGAYGEPDYTATFQRTFQLCSVDNINVDIDIACDNSCVAIAVDGGTPFYSQPIKGLYLPPVVSASQTQFNTVATQFFPSLAVGTHTITVTVLNYPNDSPTPLNFSGLGIIGTVSSATSSNSIVQETASCSSYSCGGGRHSAPSSTVAPITGNLTCFPNPNGGSFTLRGALAGTTTSKEAKIEVVDMVGKVVYTDIATIDNGGINKVITLGDNVANGVYLIKVNSGSTSKVIRVSVNR